MGFTCEIKYPDNPSGIFNAGERLTGVFELRLDKLTKIKTIRLIVRGFSKCEWVSGSGDNRKRFEDGENYFESNINLLYSVGDATSIPMGIQSYTFACELPLLLPSSIEGKHGHIRYQVTVIVERPWKSDHTSVANFSVINQYDLNTSVPNLRRPYEKEDVKHFCCGPCQSGELIIKVKLPRSAFIPGETMSIEMLVKNDSDVRVIKMNLYLNKIITYRTFNERKGEKKERVQLYKESIDGTATFSTKQFRKQFIIPAVPPSNTGLSKLIITEYELMAYAKMPCGHMDVTMFIPIVMGTIGYSQPMQYENSYPITTQPMPQPIAPPLPIAPPHHLGFITPTEPSLSLLTKQPPLQHIGFVSQQPTEPSLSQFLNANTDPSAPPPTYEETVYGQKTLNEKLLQ